MAFDWTAHVAEASTRAREALKKVKDVSERLATMEPLERAKPENAMLGKEARDEANAAREAMDAAKADAAEALAVDRELESMTVPRTRLHGLQATGDNAPSEETSTAERLAVQHEALDAYVRHGAAAADRLIRGSKLSDAEKMSLTTTDPTLAGFAAPDDMRENILEALPGFTIMRGLVSTVPTSRGAVSWSRFAPATVQPNMYTTGFTGKYQAQGAAQGTNATVQDQPTLEQLRIPVHRWQPDVVLLTEEAMEDTVGNYVSRIELVVARTYGLDVDYEIVHGAGVGAPKGILQHQIDGNIATVNSGHATLLTYNAVATEGILGLWGTLPAQYRQNATWVMNSLTFSEYLGLEDGGSTILHRPSEVNGPEPRILGRPVAFNEFMPDVAAGAEPIIFGDFRSYILAERRDLRIQRLVENYAPDVGLLAVARIGGDVDDFNAFRTQTVSA